ncbi:MAG: GIY-YIG nuclease family protein [Chitinivibrionales bacterium]
MKRSITAQRALRDATNNDLKWSVYILLCADKTLYTGISNDVPRRVADHQSGVGARYTRGRLPVRLLFQEPCLDKSSASKREHAIKRLSREEKIKLTNMLACLR